jgi:hypothetical protein
MKQARIFPLLAVFIVAMAGWRLTDVGQPILAALHLVGTTSVAAASQQAPQQPPPTIASAMDREITAAESKLWKLPKPCPKINSTSLRRA